MKQIIKNICGRSKGAAAKETDVRIDLTAITKKISSHALFKFFILILKEDSLSMKWGDVNYSGERWNILNNLLRGRGCSFSIQRKRFAEFQRRLKAGLGNLLDFVWLALNWLRFWSFKGVIAFLKWVTWIIMNSGGAPPHLMNTEASLVLVWSTSDLA